jgi:hypothetical protein
MKCETEGCAREAKEGSDFCCSECGYGLSAHTSFCNVQEYPNVPSARYFHDQNREINILARLQKAVALSEVLQAEVKEIRNISLSLGLKWGAPFESLLAHLEIDLSWLGAEIKKMTGG